MAGDSAQERTEEATPKRHQEARQKGQIARSRELSTMAVLMMSAAAILITSDDTITSLMKIMRDQFDLQSVDLRSGTILTDSLTVQFTKAMIAMAPFAGLVLIAALLSPMVVGGWIFSVESFSFKLEKLDPIKGMSRIFSLKSLIELIKALLKFIIVLSVSMAILYGSLGDIFSVGNMEVSPAISKTASMLIWSFVVISSSMIVIALIDVPFQLWDHNRQLKMTRQEVKEEYKQTDGNPELKRHLRERQREISRRRMMEKVPKADVIITNPTHYSVALKYDQNTMSAPIVVAKGRDLIAYQIRNIANANNVPIVSAPPLSRALYHSTEIDHEIPSGLFMAVAQVLAYIYRLKNNIEIIDKPEFEDIEIPNEFVRDE